MELYNRLKSEYLEEVTSYLRTKADWDFTPEFARTLHEVALAKLITLDGMKES